MSNDITPEEFQKARRISRAIQEYLDSAIQRDVRSTDIYDYLARKNLIEKDRHKGIHFRKFLDKLKKYSYLKLIPQCSCVESKNGFNEWHFHSVSKERQELDDIKVSNVNKNIEPMISEKEVDALIEMNKEAIDKLPKRNTDNFTHIQIETRKNYTRAYEYWSEKEIEIMRKTYLIFKRIDKVAELLRRQPSAVQTKINET